MGAEERQFITLLDLLNNVDIPEEGEDYRIWDETSDGYFSVASYYKSISNKQMQRSPVAGVRKIKAPPRVATFGWPVLHGRILIMDNLRRRRRITVNACPMCSADEETVDHLLFSCKVSQSLWISILAWFGSNWVFPSLILALFECWKTLTNSPKGKEMWRSFFLGMLWVLWKERNLDALKEKLPMWTRYY